MFDFLDDISETAKEVAIAATAVATADTAVTALVKIFDEESCSCLDDYTTIDMEWH